MRKKILYTGALLISFSTIFNSNAQTEIDLSNYKLSDNTISYSDYSPEKKQTIITFLDSIKLDLIILDETLNRTNDSISYELPSAGYYIQKTIINSSNINYLIAKKDGAMSLLSYNRKTKEWTQGSSLLKDGESLLSSFAYKNKFYLFNYEKKSSLIKAYTAEINGLTPFKDYDLTNFKMGKNDLSFFLKKQSKTLKVITSKSPNELFASRKAKKAYQFEEKIYFVIDDSITRSTSSIQFNLKTKKHTISYFNNTNGACESNQFNNSALTKNYIATISGCVKNATISFWSLKTKKVIKTTTLVEKELITIKNYDNLISSKKAHSIEILKAQVLLRQLANGDAAIYLNEYQNNLELLVGRLSIKKKKNKMNKGGSKGNGNGSGSGNGRGGGHKKKLDRIEKRKIKGLGLSKSYLNYESSRPQYFVSSLNLSTQKFEPSLPYQNTFKAIKTFKTERNLKRKSTQILFNKDGKFWFGYVDAITKKLHLVKMD